MSSVYRTHTCGQLRPEHVGQQARLSGWVQRKRDHGNLLFIDLRDHYGVTQVVVDVSSPVFKTAEAVRSESGVDLAPHRRGRAVVADRDNRRKLVRLGALQPALGSGEDECGHATIIGARWRRAAKARSSTRPGCTSTSPIRT